MTSIHDRLCQFGQEHLCQHLDELNPEEQDVLKKDIESVDIEEMTDIFYKATNPERSASAIDARMRTIDEKYCASLSQSSKEDLQKYEEASLRAISRGQVGVLLLAGGQEWTIHGTRLGVDYPKGMFSVGLPSGKSLYQIQIERILRLESLAEKLIGEKGHIVMYVMTSEHTKAPTEAFFEKHNYFGMKREHLVLFEQRMIPCFDFDGKMILANRTQLARAPDGNGGLYWALKHEGILDHMKTYGVEFLHAYCVDNILVKVADPIFMGFCIVNEADSANKVLEKAFPSEALGVVCKVDGVIQVVEYSEIAKETSELQNPDGKLTYSAGNICNHFFNRDFLSRVSDVEAGSCVIPHHVAKKKIPSLGAPSPSEPNGIKLEKFVFDVFQYSKSFLVWEGVRREEFSPLKNAEAKGKKDTPSTSRQALFRLHKEYIERAGGTIVPGDDSDTAIDGDVPVVEISPLLSYAGEDLETLVKGKTLKTPVLLKEAVQASNGSLKNGHI